MPARPYLQKVTLLAKSPAGIDPQGQAILEDPVEINVRFVQSGFTASMVSVDRIPIGSQVWYGRLSDYLPIASNPAQTGKNMWVVTQVDQGFNIKGRDPYNRSHLIPFSTSSLT